MKHSKQQVILETYQVVIYFCIIHNQNTPRTWMWCCVRYYLFFDEIDEHDWIVWPSNDLPIDEAVISVYRKNRPLFWSLCRWYKACWLTFWRPTILTIKRTFIRSRFINVYQLIITQLRQLNNILPPKVFIAFSGYSLKLNTSELVMRNVVE